MNYQEYSVKKIKLCRLQKDMTQEEFAEFVQIPYNLYKNFESNPDFAKPLIIIKILYHLGINFNDFNKEFAELSD